MLRAQVLVLVLVVVVEEAVLGSRSGEVARFEQRTACSRHVCCALMGQAVAQRRRR
jgi:hypothetical protein